MESPVLEKALPDGNCSFNAFVLGWCRPDVLSYVDHLKLPKHYPSNIFVDFIKQSAKILEVGLSWALVKNKLLFLRQHDKFRLQKQMTPIFRRLSINLARHNQFFRERTEEHLVSAFRDYILPIKNSVEDDVFGRHLFIRKKFAELNPVSQQWSPLKWMRHSVKPSEEMIQEANKRLVRWWFADTPDSGYENFLRAMEQQGEWAGDIELDLLADFFDVNLDVKRHNFIHHIHFDHGSVARSLFSEDQVAQLICRGVIDHVKMNDTRLRFLPLTLQEVDERLSAVPEIETIRAFVWCSPLLKSKPLLPNCEPAIKQLLLRDIIYRQDNHYFFNGDQDKTINLLEAFPDKERMLSLWKANYISTKPTMTLVNEDAAHWDYLPAVIFQADVNEEMKFNLAVLLAAICLYRQMARYFGEQICLPLSNNPFSFFSLLQAEIAAVPQVHRQPEL